MHNFYNSIVDKINNFQGNPAELFEGYAGETEMRYLIDSGDFFTDYRNLNKTYPLVKSSIGQQAMKAALDICFVYFYYLPISQIFLEQGPQAAKAIAQDFLTSAYAHLNDKEEQEYKTPPIRNYIWVTRTHTELRQKDLDSVLANKAVSPNLDHIVWVYKKDFAPRSVEFLEEHGVQVREIAEIQEQFVDQGTWYKKFTTDINLGAAVDLLKVEVVNVIGGIGGDLNHDDVPPTHYLRTYDCAVHEISFFMCKPHGMLERALKHFYASHSYENITQEETRLLPFSGFLPYNASEKNIKFPLEYHMCSLGFDSATKKWETPSADYERIGKDYTCEDDYKICIEDASMKALHECQEVQNYYYEYEMCPEPSFIPGYDHKEETWDMHD